MDFSLDCLGGFAMGRAGAPVSLNARKPRILLGLLAVSRRRTLSRARLAALLWETSDAEQARVSLRQALAQIRRAGGDGWVEADGDDLRLGTAVVTDLDGFHAALVRNDPAEAARLYRGPFLDGIDVALPDLGQAIATERARLSGLASSALMRELERVGDGPAAPALAHRLLVLDPFNEVAHRCLMKIDVARGMRNAARARFEALEAALRRDLGTTPDPETQALYDRIRRGGGSRAADPAPEPAAPAEPDPAARYLLLGLEADSPPDWSALRLAAGAAGASEEPSGPGEIVFIFECAALREVSTRALEIAAAAGEKVSFGLSECDGGDIARSIARARRIAAMAETGGVRVVRDMALRLGLSAEAGQTAVALQPDAVRPRPLLPLIGRATELAQIEAAIAAAQASGTSLVVHLLGEAGIGKSRLAAETRESAARSGMRTLTVGFDAFSPGARHLAQRIVARLPEVPAPPTGTEPTERAIWSWLSDTEIGTETELRMSALGPEILQDRIMDVLAAAIRRAAADTGLLIVIEDCHWRPVGAGDILLGMIERLRDSRVVLVLTERPHAATLDHRLAARIRSGLVRIALAPLAPSAARELVGTVAPGFAGADAVIDHAAGHPLFLIRLLESGWTSGALPSSVAELVQEQIERLPDAERASLRQASILGTSFDPADVTAIFPEAVRPRTSGDLFHETETGFAFGHDLVHRAIYESIPPGIRQDWHARAAAHFSQVDPIRWADHALKAPDDAEAGKAAVAAGNAMISSRRFSAAYPYLEAGLARGGDPEAMAELYSCRAGIRRIRGDMAGALDDYRSAHSRAVRQETRAAMLCRQALVLHRLGRGAEADRALDAAEEIADAIGLTGLGRAEIHEQRGNRAFVQGDIAACMRHHSAALAAAEATGDPRGIARGHGGIGDAAYAAGRFRTACDHFTKAIETAERAGLGLVREEYMFMRAFSLFFADPGPMAFLLADIAVDSAVQSGAARTEMIAREVRAEMRTANGDLAGLEEDLTAITDLALARGETRFEKDIATLYAFLHLRRGDDDAARARVEPLLPDAGTDAYVGGTIFGLAVLLARDRAERDRWVAEGRACLARGSLAHAVIWFHASVLERAVIDEDRELAREQIDAMLAFTSDEPVGLVTLYVRTAELILWPSTEADRLAHAAIVRDAGLNDCAQILLRACQEHAGR